MRRFLLLASIITLGLSAQAEPAHEVHKMCLQAADYKGCIKAQSKSIDITEKLRNRKVLKNQKWKSLSIFCFGSQDSKCYLTMIGKVTTDKGLKEFETKVFMSHRKSTAISKNAINCKKNKIAEYIAGTRNYQGIWRDKLQSRDEDVFNYVCRSKQSTGAKEADKIMASLSTNEISNLKDGNLKTDELIPYFYVNYYRNTLISKGELEGKKWNPSQP